MNLRNTTVGVTTALGAGVVGTYIYLATRPQVSDFWGPLQGALLGHWAASAALTVVAFLYIWTYLYFLADRKKTEMWGRPLEDRYSLLLATYVVFLTAAVLWVPLSVAARQGRPGASRGVTAVLWFTALSALTLFVLLVGLREKSLGAQETLAVIAGSWLAFHHIIWDAQVWRSGWKF